MIQPTSIQIEEPAQVNLVVMDRLGQITAVILDENMSQGEHKVIWNAEGLPSGIYFYRLTAGNHSCKGKLVVVK